jgi:hypothetical protein
VIAKTFSCNACSLILLQFVESQSNNAHGIGESVMVCNTTCSLISCVYSALFFFPVLKNFGFRCEGTNSSVFSHVRTGPCLSSFVMYILVMIVDTKHSTA